MRKLFSISILVLLALSTTAYPHKGATGIVKERMDLMDAIAGAMKTIGEMIRGKTDFNQTTANTASLEIEQHAYRLLHLFPEGSAEKPSETLPSVWKDWKRFEFIMQDMAAQSQTLANLSLKANDADDIYVQFQKLGKTCVACHSTFRQKK